MKADKELTGAFIGIVDKIDESIRSGGYGGPQIKMYVAGGLAVNYYTGARFTNDIDASFSSRIALPPAKELCATYKLESGGFGGGFGLGGEASALDALEVEALAEE
jgi:hypothetical protein